MAKCLNAYREIRVQTSQISDLTFPLLSQENPDENFVDYCDSRQNWFFAGKGEKAEKNSADPTGNVIFKIFNQKFLFGHLGLYNITNRDNPY